jgi:hypothetical protein
MKIRTLRVPDGFKCYSCKQDHIELASEVSKKTGVDICYTCAFASLKSRQLIEGATNKLSHYEMGQIEKELL